MRIQNLDKNAIYLLIGKFLKPDFDWKQLLAEQGAAVAKEQLRTLWAQRLKGAAGSIASAMEDEGWSWEAASTPAFLQMQNVKLTPGEETLGPGFIISRDALYALLRASGAPGGLVRDSLRDAYDNAVWNAIEHDQFLGENGGTEFDANTPLLTIVEATQQALIDTVL